MLEVGSLDIVLTSFISLPGHIFIVALFCYNLRSILWRQGGAVVRFLRAIIVSGLWSDSIVRKHPYRSVRK